MKIPQFKSFVNKEDYIAEIHPVFEKKYIAEGPLGQQFREKLLDITGAEHAVLASNGTLAIYLALRALGIGRGDEVIVQNVTFIASGNAVEMVGATPVFVDIKAPNDMTIDLDLVKAKLTPNTKAIMIAHLFGSACTNIYEIRDFCRENNLLLVEDAAQALAITDGKEHCGTIGDIGTFSFYADKTITTGEGGLVVTNDEEIYENMLFLRNQGRRSSGTFVHERIGYNFRMTDLQSALGLAQLKKLDIIKEEKRKIYEEYQKHLGGKVEFLKLHPEFTFIPFRVVVFVDSAVDTMHQMKEDGIEPRSVFYPLHRQPCYEYLGYDDSDFPQSMECFERGICLPTWIGMTPEMIEYTSKSLLKSIGKA